MSWEEESLQATWNVQNECKCAGDLFQPPFKHPHVELFKFQCMRPGSSVGALSGPMYLEITLPKPTTAKPSGQSHCPNIRCSHRGRLPHIVTERASTPKTIREAVSRWAHELSINDAYTGYGTLIVQNCSRHGQHRQLPSVAAFTLGQTGQSRWGDCGARAETSGFWWRSVNALQQRELKYALGEHELRLTRSRLWSLGRSTVGIPEEALRPQNFNRPQCCVSLHVLLRVRCANLHNRQNFCFLDCPATPRVILP